MVELEGMILPHNMYFTCIIDAFLSNPRYEFSKISPTMVELEGMILSNNKYFMYF